MRGEAHPLFGRESELAEVANALDRLQAGTPQLITVQGEAGIGKTRLVAEVRRMADDQGLLVLSGAASRFEAGLPFAPVVDALDDYVRSLPPKQLERLGDEQLAELAQVLPSLGSGALNRPAGLQDERYRSHRAVRALLESLAAENPLVLTLDDMHWGDAATIELVANLVRRPPRGPVVLVLAYRTDQLPARLEGALADRERGEGAIIRLGPLADAEIEGMSGGLMDPGELEQLVSLSGGNPFYLEELMRSGRSGPSRAASYPAGLTGIEVPGAIAAALDQELAGLPEETRLVAMGAAVAGETFSPELAAEAAEVSEQEALAAIDELLDRDLLRATSVPRRFRFRHPIVHGAVYESAKPGWRLAAHGRVASALEARGSSPLTRAPHLESSATPGDADAAAVLAQAAAAADLRAPSAAAHWYAAALRLLPEEAAGTRLGLTIAMAQALGYAGRLDEAREALDDVLAMLDSGDHATRGQVAAAAARIDQLLGRHAEALELLRGALAAVPDQTGAEATELKVQLAGASFFSGDFEALRRWVGEALEEATARGDVATQAAATGSLGAAEYMTGDIDAARAHLDEAEALLAGLDDQAVARRLHSIVWHGMTEVYLERFDRANALFERGIAVARSTGHGHVTTLNRIGRALIMLWRGQLAEAGELLESAAEAAGLTGNDQFLAWALSAQCRAALLTGDLPAAIRCGEASVRCAGPEPNPLSAIAGCYLAEARLEADEPPGRLRDQLLAAVGGPEISLVERGFRPHVQELLTRIELAAGDLDAAAEWARLATETAEGMRLSGRSADAARARAAVALARGEREAAASAALEGAEFARRAGLPVEEARARTLAGRALGEAEPDAAIRELDAAREQLESVGAKRHRDEAASELRQLGRRVARPKRGRKTIGEGLASLSEREGEVARLVSEGRTNKRIAAELFLSEKTIEKHIARIFEKLGVSTRTQIAAAIGRENSLP